MSPRKRTTSFQLRLSPAEHIKFDELCRTQGKNRPELGRDAISWYLTHHERLSSDQREGLLEKRLKKMENRLAALQARTAIDIGMVYHLIWRNMDKATRDDALAWAYNSTIARLKRKLPGKDAEIKEMVMNDPLNRQA
jgi:hypothetical protein